MLETSRIHTGSIDIQRVNDRQLVEEIYAETQGSLKESPMGVECV